MSREEETSNYGPQKETPLSYPERHASAESIPVEKLKRIEELERNNGTRYKEIQFAVGTIRQNIENIAANLEEIFILRNQAEQVNRICSLITSKLREMGISSTIWSNVPRMLSDRFKREYNYNVLNSSVDEYLPEESSIEEARVNEALNILENIDYRRLRRPFFQETGERAIELKSKFETLSNLLNVPLFNSELQRNDFEKAKDEFADKIVTPKPIPSETELSEAVGETIEEYKSLQREIKYFPPQIKASAHAIAQMWRTQSKFVTSGIDRKWKATYPSWFKIIKTEIEHGKHAAHSLNPLFTISCGNEKSGCAKKNVYMQVEETQLTAEQTETGESGTLFRWKCPDCGGYDQKKRNFTREQIGDKEDEVIDFAIEFVNSIPTYVAFWTWYRSWKEGYVSQQTINLSPKLADRA